MQMEITKNKTIQSGKKITIKQGKKKHNDHIRNIRGDNITKTTATAAA